MRIDEIQPGHLYVLKHQAPVAVRASAVGPIAYVPDPRHNGKVARAGGTPKAAGLSVHGRWMYWTADGPAEHVEPVLIYSIRAEFSTQATAEFMAGWYRSVRSIALSDHLAAHGYASTLDPVGALSVSLAGLDRDRLAGLADLLARWTWPVADEPDPVG